MEQNFLTTFLLPGSLFIIMLGLGLSLQLDDFRRIKQKIPMLATHNFENLIGGYDPENIKETKKGLEVVGEVDLSTQQGREKHSLAKNGYLNSFSIGFQANKENISINANGNRVFQKVDLYEISLVPVPANPKARITGVKSFKTSNLYPLMDECVAWDKNKSLKQIKEKGNSSELGLFYEKFPFLYVEGGIFKAVPRGLFSIVEELKTSNESLDISQEDRILVEKNINNYYAKMGKTIPFSDSECIEIKKDFTIDSEWVKRNKLDSFLNETILMSRLDDIILKTKHNSNYRGE